VVWNMVVWVRMRWWCGLGGGGGVEYGEWVLSEVFASVAYPQHPNFAPATCYTIHNFTPSLSQPL
jgi:hypothetical protein